MVRPLIAGGIVAILAMVTVAAMPTRVSPQVPRLTPPHVQRTPPRYTSTNAQGGPARPADAAGTLKGEVRDAAGRPLTGAVVDALHPASGWRGLALTDARAMFVMDRVPAGELTVIVRRGALEFSTPASVRPGKTTTLVVQPDTSLLGHAVTAGVAPQPVDSSTAATTLGAPLASEALRARAVGNAAVQSPQFRHHVPTGPPTSMDAYARVDPSGYRRVADAPLSTFSVDVDTASYSNARRFLMEGELPPPDAVRVEEWVNYFPYAYPGPQGGDAFGVSTALTACPWNSAHQLLRIGVRGRAVPTDAPPARNLVFLVDVSGSMMSSDRLPLVRTALRMLTDQLTARDRIALVVYAGRSGLVLPPTPGDQKARIHEALQGLEAGGSTNGAGGIQLAYGTARAGFITGGVNRVVLATDGDFNVGMTSLDDLTRLIEDERQKGVFLSVLGVGRGNLKDATLEQLADRGNGNYAYVDSLQEARRVLVEQVGATLVTIAKDVKLQVEFNPRHVGAYRLVGYENRALQTEDFIDDARDAGEIGAGRTVTALYEIVPPAAMGSLAGVASMRYRQPAAARSGHDDEIATVSVRHKLPDGDRSVLGTHAVSRAAITADVDTAFASAVAEVALALRRDPLASGATLAGAARRAEASIGADPGGWRAEFVRLAHLAQALQGLKGAETSEP